MDIEDKNANRWTTISPLGEQTLTIDDRGFALHTIDNKVKIDSFPLAELKQIQYEEPSECLMFRTKKWRMSSICVGGLTTAQRDEIVEAICSRLGDKATKSSKQIDFWEAAQVNLPVILLLGGFFNAILIFALTCLDMSSLDEGSFGGRRSSGMAAGVIGLAHSFGWTGIVVINLILLAVYLLHSYFLGSSKHQVHRILID